MRRCLTALGVVVVVVAGFVASTASAAPSSGLTASMTLTSTGTTCSGTLAISWDGRSDKITALSWSADPSSTGTLSYVPPRGAQFSKPRGRDTETVDFTLTQGTGASDVLATGVGFRSQVVTNTVTCPMPDLVVNSIASTPTTPLPNSYTVTVSNAGSGVADLSGIAVQGYYSATQDTWPTNDPACGQSFNNGTTLNPGASIDIFVGCGLAPPAGDTWLVVKVDATDGLPESNEANNVGSLSLA